MVLYLRNKRNKDIVEIELNVKTDEGTKFVECSCVIDITGYSKLLLSTPEQNQKILIQEFDDLSEIRGWMWERYFAVKKNTESEYDGVLTEVRGWLKQLADKYELNVVED